LPDYVDVGADGRENDEDEATKMRQFYGITASPDACEVMARELIVNNWPMVLTIAAALLDRKVFTGAHVAGLADREHSSQSSAQRPCPRPGPGCRIEQRAVPRGPLGLDQPPRRPRKLQPSRADSLPAPRRTCTQPYRLVSAVLIPSHG